VKRAAYKQAIQGILKVKDQEILCSEFAAKLPRYVDLVTAGDNPSQQMPEVSHHIHQCPECGDVYRALREIVGKSA
jgi:hypothetical protein